MPQKHSNMSRHQEPIPPAVSRRTWIRALAILAVAAALIGLAYRSGTSTRPPTPVDPTSTTTAATPTEPASAAKPAESEPTPPPPKADLSKLKGRWQRLDGDYLLEVRDIGDKGVVDAAYFNPQPIHVARAGAVQDSGNVALFVELRDTGYPGCTYRLVYRPQQDRLEGVYYQAAQQTSYDVVFDRAK
jgi:hypothetical protein